MPGAERNKPEHRPEYRRVFYGQNEPIFRTLSERVIDNFRTPASENAVLWNTFYPRRQSLELTALIALKPLWGTKLGLQEDALEPYFWGMNVAGERLPGLDQALEELDGPGQKTEVDLFLLGSQNLIAVEAKNRAAPGRCSRYIHKRCPEIHTTEPNGEDRCRYWENPDSCFVQYLEFGARPRPGDDEPLCSHYYQLSRTLLTVMNLARELELQPFLWMVVPDAFWPRMQKEWTAFTELLLSDDQWRGARVLSWKAVMELPAD